MTTFFYISKKIGMESTGEKKGLRNTMSSKQKPNAAAQAKDAARQKPHALRAENFSVGPPDFAQPPLKRSGRPIKEARKGRRYQIGVIVTGEIKATIAQRAKASGRTISREVEMMIERLVQYEQMFERMKMDIEEIRQSAIDAEFRRQGYTSVASMHGNIWFPPGLSPEKFFVNWEAMK